MRRTLQRISPAAALIVALVLAVLVSETQARPTRPWGNVQRTPSLWNRQPHSIPSLSHTILNVRGGASKRKSSAKSAGISSSRTATGKKKVGATVEKEKPSALGDTLLKYKKILPLTRIYITLVGIETILGLVLGEELTQVLLALDPIRFLNGFELWRPFTAACFLGPPSIGWLMSGYYLFEYGSNLERAYGTPQHLMFLLSQVVTLSILCILTGTPFFASSMVTAMLHVLSRSMPHQKVRWLIFTVPYWSLPYGLMVTDMLQAQSAMAALPHILGILSGHFYHFHKFVWPKVHGGEDWLAAPDFLVKRLDPNARQPTSSTAKASASRKRGQGRKLGSSA